MLVRSSVIVNRPVGEVFAYVADYRNDPRWRTEVREMRYTPDNNVGAGAHVTETSALFGRRVVTESLITAYEPNRRVDFESISGPYRVRGSRIFEPVDGGTRVTCELEWLPSRRAAKLIAPLMGRSYQRSMDRYAERLRAILEEAS